MRLRLITPFVLLVLLALFALCTHAQAQQFRVKRIQREQHTLTKGVVKTDSAVFYYSGANAGQVSWKMANDISRNPTLLYSPHATLQYDSMISKVDGSGIPTTGHTGNYRSTQRFNSLVWLMDFKLYRVNSNGTSSLETEQKNTYTGGKLGQAIINKDKYVYSYKNGILDRMSVHPASSYASSFYYYSYDQAGNLKQVMRTGASLPSHDTVWTLYNYDNQNRIIEQVTMDYSYSWAQKDTSLLILYGYDGKGDLVQEDGYSGPSLEQTARLLSTYNNLHNKTELILLYSLYPATAIDTYQRIKFTYDNYDLLRKLETEQWDNGQWTSRADSFSAAYSSHAYTFEYEVAWPTGVPEIEDAANIKLYPSPASDFIRIETEWKNAKPFTAAILDMQGRVVRRWDEPAIKNYNRSIPLTELPPGMYVLKLHCGEEQLTKQFAVYK